MKKNIALVLFYNKQNRYSFNALAGAIETDQYLSNLNIYFPNREEELLSELKSIVKKHDKVIIGISFFTPQLWETYKLIKHLKEKYNNNILYIAGGPHPTGDPKGTLRLGFDIVALGEGEETIKELLQGLDLDTDLGKIKGIAYFNESGEYNFTGRRQLINLDHYPPFAPKYGKFGPIEITRSCPYVCYFCQTPRLFGVHPRHRSIDKICEYVSIMKNKSLTDIRFITPNAFSYGSTDGKEINKIKLEELLSSVRKIIQKHGKIFIGSFPSEVRPEHVTEETVNLVLKYANNDNLVIGGQSGSQRILDSCHRGHSVEDIYTAVKLTLKSGLKANVDFIFGLPGETENDVRETIKVIKDLIKMGAKIHTHTFIPLPQTPYAKLGVEKIGENLKQFVNELVSTGVAYGNWIEQGRIAKKIAKYFKTGKIEA